MKLVEYEGNIFNLDAVGFIEKGLRSDSHAEITIIYIQDAKFHIPNKTPKEVMNDLNKINSEVSDIVGLIERISGQIDEI